MRVLQRLAVVAAVGVLAVGISVVPAQATSDTTVPITGGVTSVTVNPAVTKALLQNRILPYATDAKTSLVWTQQGPTVRYGFPITSDSFVTAAGNPLTITGGEIAHTGGVRFVNLRNFKALKVSDFDIRLGEGLLYATKVNNQPAEVPVFKIIPTTLVPTLTSDGFAVLTGVRLELTKAAADALNASLRTSVFTEGLPFGTATVRAEI
ncbi:MAG: hypothetical protein LH645_08820 [Actinomycetia bacterium]|nr:hypothetical protein [Actinomycetes bacterium]